MFRRSITLLVAVSTVIGMGIVITETPAAAGHTHYVATPNGECHQVAQGQTSINDTSHGGHHRYHDNVHLGATGESGSDGDDNLGRGRGEAQVYKQGPAPAQCDGD